MEPYHELRDKPWGNELVYTPPGLGRVGKLLFVKAGAKLSLQYHEEKEETLALFSGQALLWLGEEKLPMEMRAGYTIKPGVVHRVEALEDSFIMEVSSPEQGKTVRLEDDYHRSDEIL